MSQFAVKRPKAVVKIGEEVLKYLAGTPTLGLYYGAVEEISGHGEHHQLPIKRDRRTMEAHYDAAFAPGGGKSMTGLVVKYAGAPVFWALMRQATVALSTAEAGWRRWLMGGHAARWSSCLKDLWLGPSTTTTMQRCRSPLGRVGHGGRAICASGPTP